MEAFLLPQRASWCCLSFWHESACSEKDSFVNNLSLLACISNSFADGSARFMRQPYEPQLANYVTISSKNDAGLQSTALLRLLANCTSVGVLLVHMICMRGNMHDLEQLPQSWRM